MKKSIFYLCAILLISSCTKQEDPIVSVKQDVEGRIQYSHDTYKESIDSINDPKAYSINILVDLSKKKTVLLDDGGYISDIYFKISTRHHDNILYSPPTNGVHHDPDWVDLNQGASGKYIYFYYNKTTVVSEAIGYFYTTTGSGNTSSYTCVNGDTGNPADLNSGAGGAWIWANAKKFDMAYPGPIIGLGTIVGNSSSIINNVPVGWYLVPNDPLAIGGGGPVNLNLGAGGAYIYFIVKRAYWK